MTLNKLVEVKLGGELSSAEAQEINRVLASTAIKDLPSDQLTNVKDYLEAAFATQPIEREHVQPLTELLEQLRGYA
tara:strand:- start:172 stop:399 length:228 start_codon:yes stop_codon:yes gene_type:complete